jgi:hypothetical protein
MNTLQIMTEKFQRDKLTEILNQCSPEQQELFHRIFPNGPRSEQLYTAYDLCERTIEKNLRGRK